MILYKTITYSPLSFLFVHFLFILIYYVLLNEKVSRSTEAVLWVHWQICKFTIRMHDSSFRVRVWFTWSHYLEKWNEKRDIFNNIKTCSFYAYLIYRRFEWHSFYCGWWFMVCEKRIFILHDWNALNKLGFHTRFTYLRMSVIVGF